MESFHTTYFVTTFVIYFQSVEKCWAGGGLMCGIRAIE